MENQKKQLSKSISTIVYKEILPGDLRKFKAESNDAQTGGGARDIRFNPVYEFYPIFEKMFPKKDELGVLSGYFQWSESVKTEAYIYPPTNARPNELRLAVVHKSFLQDKVPTDANDCVLLLVQDTDGKVWPFFTSRVSLETDDWNLEVSSTILDCLDSSRRKGVAAVGYVDYVSGRKFKNGY